jgi:hypothetical protein
VGGQPFDQNYAEVEEEKGSILILWGSRLQNFEKRAHVTQLRKVYVNPTRSRLGRAFFLLALNDILKTQISQKIYPNEKAI